LFSVCYSIKRLAGTRFNRRSG